MPRYKVWNSWVDVEVEADTAEDAAGRFASEHPDYAADTVLIKQLKETE